MSFLTFNKDRLVSGAGLESMLFQVSPSWAQIITDELDPGTTRIQSTLTVDPGETFTIDVVSDR